MRQIKFRCWTGKWFITDDFYISPEGWVGEMTSTGTYNSFDYIEWKKDWIVQQFTGLYDLKGTAIYEGDIVQYTQHLFNIPPEKFPTKIKEVKWLDWECKWSLLETNAGESDFAVIGNIYENPELLNNK